MSAYGLIYRQFDLVRQLIDELIRYQAVIVLEPIASDEEINAAVKTAGRGRVILISREVKHESTNLALHGATVQAASPDQSQRGHAG